MKRLGIRELNEFLPALEWLRDGRMKGARQKGENDQASRLPRSGSKRVRASSSQACATWIQRCLSGPSACTASLMAASACV